MDKLRQAAWTAIHKINRSTGFDEESDVLLMEAASVLREALAEQAEQEPFMCEPVPPVSEDGWTDWVCPTPRGYLMQCCDCGLIHEVDTRVAKYEPMPSEEFEVVDDPDMQCQWRMRRRDDLSNPVKQEPVRYFEQYQGQPIEEIDESRFYLTPEEYRFKLYAAPVSIHSESETDSSSSSMRTTVRTKDLTEEDINELWNTALMIADPTAGNLRFKFARAVIAAYKEKNNANNNT